MCCVHGCGPAKSYAETLTTIEGSGASLARQASSSTTSTAWTDDDVREIGADNAQWNGGTMLWMWSNGHDKVVLVHCGIQYAAEQYDQDEGGGPGPHRPDSHTRSVAEPGH